MVNQTEQEIGNTINKLVGELDKLIEQIKQEDTGICSGKDGICVGASPPIKPASIDPVYAMFREVGTFLANVRSASFTRGEKEIEIKVIIDIPIQTSSLPASMPKPPATGGT